MRKFPSYPSRAHSSGQARIKINGRSVYLGVFGSPESWREYERLLAVWNADPHAPVNPDADGTVAEVIHAWTAAHPDNDQNRRIIRACRVLVRLYGTTPAAKFDANALEAVRMAMVNGSWMNADELADNAKHKRAVGWCANQVHDCIGRIRRVWRWAERKKLVPANSYSHLLTLPPIGRAEDVRRTPRRRAADEQSVQAVLGHLTPMVSAMLQLQCLTGMRPGELVKMCVSKIDVSGELWLYVMDQHKTLHLDGQDSTVVLGPESQLILFPYLEAAKRCGNDPIWTPRPSSSAHYTATGYYRAIARACERMGVKHFTPYQIRHLVRLRVTREMGLDAARAILRHKSVSMTNEYAHGVDIQTQRDVAAKMG